VHNIALKWEKYRKQILLSLVLTIVLVLLPLEQALADPFVSIRKPTKVIKTTQGGNTQLNELDGNAFDSDGTTTPSLMWSATGPGNVMFTDPTVEDPTFTVDVPGSYMFTLTASGNPPASRTIPVNVVDNNPPVPDFKVNGLLVPPTKVPPSVQVNIDASISTDADPGDQLQYTLKLTDPSGSTTSLPQDSNLDKTTQFTPVAEGNYIVTLLVTDGFVGTPIQIQKTVRVSTNEPPTSVIAPIAPMPTDGQPISLDGSGSTTVDPKDTIPPDGFEWTVTEQPEGSNPVFTPSANVAMPTLTTDTPGTYRVTLKVTDSNGLTSTTQSPSIQVQEAGVLRISILPTFSPNLQEGQKQTYTAEITQNGQVLTIVPKNISDNISWSINGIRAVGGTTTFNPNSGHYEIGENKIKVELLEEVGGKDVNHENSVDVNVSKKVGFNIPPGGTIIIPNELHALNLGGTASMALVSDPANLLGDSVNGFGFMDTHLSVDLADCQVSFGDIFLLDDQQREGQTDITDGDLFFYDSVVDAFVDVTLEDNDPRPGRNFAPGLAVDNGQETGSLAFFECVGPTTLFHPSGAISAETGLPNLGATSQVPFMDWFRDIPIPTGVDINGDGPQDDITFPTSDLSLNLFEQTTSAPDWINDFDASETANWEVNPITQVSMSGIIIFAEDIVIPVSVPAPPVVPNVVGLAQVFAENQIILSGLTVGTVTTANSDTVPAGNVISQNPVGDTVVTPNSSVDLVVSLGPTLVAVPDVVGLSQASAEAAIVGAGLAVGSITTANSDTVPAGDVISQDPTAGTTVAPNAPVNLVVSLGAATIAVPDVVGLPQADAEAAIVAAGLTVGTVTTANSDTVPAGDVISQNPTRDTNVASETPVNILVSLGPSKTKPVGGEFLPIETTALLLAGTQSFSWMIPVLASIVGIGLFFLRRK